MLQNVALSYTMLHYLTLVIFCELGLVKLEIYTDAVIMGVWGFLDVLGFQLDVTKCYTFSTFCRNQGFWVLVHGIHPDIIKR